MINLYIDTNAYLTFYHLTSDDLEELKKLKVLIEKGEITLYLPEQTYDEFNRNRDVKIADALMRFKEDKLNNQFPQISKEYEEYGKMREAIKMFDKNKTQLLNKLSEDIFEKNLAADKVIEKLFDKAFFYETTTNLIEISKTRFELGRPPGKNNSYGDAINWETILEIVPKNEDLYFISDDKDFYSKIDQSFFNSYLKDEWFKKKNSQIYYYRRISEFFKDQFPQIKIASEYEKESLLHEFAESGSFATTRNKLNKLSKFDDFSTDQINTFVSACINNIQINWIKSDHDIKVMISKIISLNKDKIDKDLKQQLDDEFQYTK